METTAETTILGTGTHQSIPRTMTMKNVFVFLGIVFVVGIVDYFDSSAEALGLRKPGVKSRNEIDVENRPIRCHRSRYPHYYISSYGADGVGHQMEAKLSCLAIAAASHNSNQSFPFFTYVHQPIQQLQHSTDPATMEALFSMSTTIQQNVDLSQVAVMYDANTMQIVQREPFWFDQKLSEKTHCTYESIAVFSADNCWDYFWCHTDKMNTNALWKDNIRPTLGDNILKQASYSVEKQSNVLYVTMHVRLGDAGGRRADFGWCNGVIQRLAQVARNKPELAFLHLTVHSDGSREEIEQGLNITDSSDVVQLEIYARGDPHATIDRMMGDMITADILVASDSSLSHVAALLRDAPRKIVLHPSSAERIGMVHLGWLMLRQQNENEFASCARSSLDARSCVEWKVTTTDFWTQLVSTALSTAAPSGGAPTTGAPILSPSSSSSTPSGSAPAPSSSPISSPSVSPTTGTPTLSPSTSSSKSPTSTPSGSAPASSSSGPAPGAPSSAPYASLAPNSTSETSGGGSNRTNGTKLN